MARKTKERDRNDLSKSRCSATKKNYNLFDLSSYTGKDDHDSTKNLLKSSPPHIYLFFLKSKENKEKNVSFFQTKSYSR